MLYDAMTGSEGIDALSILGNVRPSVSLLSMFNTDMLPSSWPISEIVLRLREFESVGGSGSPFFSFPDIATHQICCLWW